MTDQQTLFAEPEDTRPRLTSLIEAARAHRMTPEEAEAQRQSFARGNAAIDRDWERKTEDADTHTQRLQFEADEIREALGMGTQADLAKVLSCIAAISNDGENARRDLDALKSAVATHHAQKADDRCIEDDDRLYAAAGLPPCDRRVGDKFEMLKNCARFIDRRCQPGEWPTYADLEAERNRMLDALRFYEDKENYDETVQMGYEMFSRMAIDRGGRARAATPVSTDSCAATPTTRTAVPWKGPTE